MMNIKIEDVQPKKDGMLKLSFTNGFDDDIESWLRQIFETEMLSAEIKRGKKRTSICIYTRNQERLEIMRQAIVKVYVQSLKIPTNDN